MQGADDVAATECREHTCARNGVERGAHGRQRRRLGHGEVAPSGDDDDVAGVELFGHGGLAEHLGDLGGSGTGCVPDRPPRVLRHARRLGRELDDLRASLLDGVTQPQMEDGQLFLQVGADENDRGGVGGLFDRGPW